MPSAAARPQTYKKPTIDDIDPIDNYIPASVRDKVSLKAYGILRRLRRFVEEECIPADEVYLQQLQASSRTAVSPSWSAHSSTKNFSAAELEGATLTLDEECRELPIVAELRARAKELGLWNLLVLQDDLCMPVAGTGAEQSLPSGLLFDSNLTTLEYALLCQFIGRSLVAQEVTNTSHVNTGTMELLLKHGDPMQLQECLSPLLHDDATSSFLMSEKNVSSSDALNVATTCTFDFDSRTMTISGNKWFASSVGDPHCRVWLVLCLTEQEEGNIYKKHSIVVVRPEDLNESTTTITPIDVLGHDHDELRNTKYYEVEFSNLTVPLSILGSRGDGFQIAQQRSNASRVYQCMKLCGMGHEALRRANHRASVRKVFGVKLQKSEHFKFEVANWKLKIEMCRLLCCNAAIKADVEGMKQARDEISMAKIMTPKEMSALVDWSMQIHGSLGICENATPLVRMWTLARSLRINEGPDEALLSQLGRTEIMALNKSNKFYEESTCKRGRGMLSG